MKKVFLGIVIAVVTAASFKLAAVENIKCTYRVIGDDVVLVQCCDST